MGHRMDYSDILDMLEESKLRRLPVRIRMRDGRVFEDRVTDIGVWEGEDHVAFAVHEFVPIRRISRIGRAYPVVYTYAGKH
jgi:hypothetical protein